MQIELHLNGRGTSYFEALKTRSSIDEAAHKVPLLLLSCCAGGSVGGGDVCDSFACFISALQPEHGAGASAEIESCYAV
jgi:hypothetical protein